MVAGSKGIVQGINTALEEGNVLLKQGVNEVISIRQRHSRLKEVVAEIGSLMLGFEGDIASVDDLTKKAAQSVTEAGGLLQKVDTTDQSRIVAPLNSRVAEVHEATSTAKEGSAELRAFTKDHPVAFFAGLQETFTRLGGDIDSLEGHITSAINHNTAAIEVGEAYLPNL